MAEPSAIAASLELLALSPPGWGATLLRGLANTVMIALGAYAVGIALGICGAFGKLYGGPLTRDLLGLYTTLVRAIPELVLILILYFAVTDLVNQVMLALGYDRIQISGIAAGITVLGVVQGAYATEVLRGAIQSVPPGQIEAARAYGMSPLMVARRVTLPLMLPAAIPGMANLWMIVTKDTALLAVVGFAELVQASRQAAGTTKAFFTFFMAAGVLYLCMSLISNRFFARLEAWANKGTKRGEG